MTEVSVAEAKARLTDLIRLVEKGESVHITRRGKPVALLVSETELAALQARAPEQDLQPGGPPAGARAVRLGLGRRDG